MPTNEQINELNHEGVMLCKQVWKNSALWKEHYEKAISMFQDALGIDENNPVTLTNLGTALSDSGKHKEALEFLRKAEELGYKDGNLFYAIGVALVNTNANTDQARQYFKLSQEVDKNAYTFQAYFDPHGH